MQMSTFFWAYSKSISKEYVEPNVANMAHLVPKANAVAPVSHSISAEIRCYLKRTGFPKLKELIRVVLLTKVILQFYTKGCLILLAVSELFSCSLECIYWNAHTLRLKCISFVVYGWCNYINVHSEKWKWIIYNAVHALD